jgi:mannose-6-phosphate isomerase-like protein (cupin superfamily)
MTKPSEIQHFLKTKHVPKGWGYEKWIVNKEQYCGKLLFFKKNKKCSWHYHKIKDEVFYIHSGQLEVTYGYDEDINKAQVTILEPGDTFYVPTGLIHQMKGIKDTEMYEFSTQHFDEDSIRVIKGD